MCLPVCLSVRPSVSQSVYMHIQIIICALTLKRIHASRKGRETKSKQKRPTIIAKETYCYSKRDLCQQEGQRDESKAKETYYYSKRDLLL